jgi:hypothetical protein
MKLRAKVLLSGKTACGVEVPEKVVTDLGSTRRPPVRVTINGYTYRSSIAPMSGTYMLGISEEVRNNTGVKAGDVVDIDLELDTAPREITVPADLKAALDRDPKAKAFFEGLNYSNKRRLVEPIAAIKTPETRERRVERTIANLRAGKA